MPKERRVPSFSSDRSAASPYSSSPKTTKKNIVKNLVQSLGGEKDWEEAKCPICLEPPHNAVLLLCSNHEKGCLPYMCNTSNRQSNCLDQYLKSSASTTTRLCALCRGKISEWIVVEPVRKFMNSVPRSCSVETCGFSGTYMELEKHAGLEHPSVRPSEVDPVRQQYWMMLQHERDLQDRISMVLDGDFEGVFIPEETDTSSRMPPILLVLPPDDYNEMSNGARFVISSGTRRTTRMRTGGYFPRHQLAGRTDDPTN